MLRTAAMLTLFAVLGAELVSFSYQGTAEQIDRNRRAVLLRSLNSILPPDHYDNDLLNDTLIVFGRGLLGTHKPVTIYRARRNGRPVAVAFMPVAPDGYSGAIKLLVGIYADGTLAGVRVVEHHETPGLGDAIEAKRSTWILGFNGHSLHNPPLEQWKVKRDGGAFDQFTGATITPRTIVNTVKNTLLYVRDNKDALYDRQATAPGAG